MKVLKKLLESGITYEPGDEIDLDTARAARLASLGLVEAPVTAPAVEVAPAIEEAPEDAPAVTEDAEEVPAKSVRSKVTKSIRKYANK